MMAFTPTPRIYVVSIQSALTKGRTVYFIKLQLLKLHNNSLTLSLNADTSYNAFVIRNYMILTLLLLLLLCMPFNYVTSEVVC